MDKRDKKRSEVLKQKIAKSQQLLAAAKKQMDDPEDVVRLQKEIVACEARMKKLRESDA